MDKISGFLAACTNIAVAACGTRTLLLHVDDLWVLPHTNDFDLNGLGVGVLKWFVVFDGTCRLLHGGCHGVKRPVIFDLHAELAYVQTMGRR